MRRVPLLVPALLGCMALFAQGQAQPRPEQKEPENQSAKGAPEQDRKAFRPVNPSARLAAAKTAFVRNAVGSDIAYNVITSAMESWGRFRLVGTPESADIVVEVSAPGTGGSGVSVSSSVSRVGPMGRQEQSSGRARDISNGPVRIIVYDARSHVALWSASEQPHFAIKQKGKEDQLVQASERLFNRFRDRVEPENNKE
jgi:hypothetical protein